MKRCLMILAALICLSGTSLVAAPVDQGGAPADAAIDFAALTANQSVDKPAAWRLNYPSCFALDGRSCTTSGFFGYCLLAPYEPEVCICGYHGGSTLTLRCVW